MKTAANKFFWRFLWIAWAIAVLTGAGANPARADNTHTSPCDRSLLADDTLSICYRMKGIFATDVKWLRGLADRGNPHAEYTLGNLYFFGAGVPENYFDALSWYRKAFKNGDTNAKATIQFTEWMLANAYLDGYFGLPRDQTKVLYWMERSADDGDVGVLAMLSRGFEYGDPSIGLKSNYTKAVYWNRKFETVSPNESSEFMLGLAYLNGNGVSRNYQEAASWFRNAAARGDADAEHNLGIMYMKGEGVTLNPGAAADWFYKAGTEYLKQGDRDDALLEDELIKGLQDQYGDLLPNGFLAKQLVGQIYAPAATSQPTSHPSPPPPRTSLNEGTGWPVAGGFIVTNHHVIAGADSIWIRTVNGTKARASIAADDPKNDLVLLEVSNPAALPDALSLSSSPAQVGESVFALGYPQPNIMGGDIKLTSGLISAAAGPGDDPRFYQTNTEIQAGSSGSPLLDMEGEVVGIMSDSLNAVYLLKHTGDLPEDVNYAIKVVYLKALLQSVKPEVKLHQLPVAVASLENLDKRIAPSVVRVFAIIPASNQN